MKNDENPNETQCSACGNHFINGDDGKGNYCETCIALGNTLTLSKAQKEAIKKPCPSCGEGKLKEVEGEIENYLWCDVCDLSMDCSGNWTGGSYHK